MGQTRELPDARPSRQPAGGSDSAVWVRDLRMSYGDREVLRGVDFEVRAGEVVCLLGPNGAGKTTTIEILQGFRRRSAGEVRLLGVDPAGGDEDWRARVGVVLQSWRDHSRWTPRRLLRHLGKFYRPYSTEGRSRPRDADELLTLVGLAERGDQKIGTLSGGQRRRLDVAIGVLGRPDVLFLDEPTAPFDPQARRDFHVLVRDLADQDGTTILLTTHDLDEAEKLADRILILAEGSILADGTPAELSERLGGASTVSWRQHGQTQRRTVENVTDGVRDLFSTDHDSSVTDLRVHHASLEDTYLTMIGHRASAANASRPTRTQETP